MPPQDPALPLLPLAANTNPAAGKPGDPIDDRAAGRGGRAGAGSPGIILRLTGESVGGSPDDCAVSLGDFWGDSSDFCDFDFVRGGGDSRGGGSTVQQWCSRD